jgi:AMP-polyphosphate phosphotransferase
MLEKVDLSIELSQEEYRAQAPLLCEKLTLLQRTCWGSGIPVVILFEGWDASGKGTSINFLAQNMDPRGFKIQPIQAATEYESQMPWLWRYWLKLPNYGEIAIFDRSWYGRVLVERVEGLISPETWREAYQDILEFERAISSDGYVLIKFFLHISKKEQDRRFKRLEKDNLQKWRVQKEDWTHHKKYDQYLEATEEMLARTEAEWGTWSIIESSDRRWARIKMLNIVCRRMEEALTARNVPLPVVEAEPADLVAQEEA